MSVPSSPFGLLPAFAPNDDGDAHVKFKIHHDDVNGGKLQWSPTSNKRTAALEEKSEAFYPTPVPTSSVHDSSSPTRAGAKTEVPRLDLMAVASPSLTRDVDDGRSPLMTLPMLELSRNGASKTIGRSSQSCDVAVSSRNKLVSRVHARAKYELKDRTVVIDCLGWNGLIVTIPDENGSTKDYEIDKGQSLTTEYVHGIKLNIRGERALVVVDDEETDDERPIEMSSSPTLVPEKESEQEDQIMGGNTEESETVPQSNEQAVLKSEEKIPATTKPVPPAKAANKKRTADKIQGDEKKKLARSAKIDEKELKRLLTNHLAFSRLSSTPLTTICKSNSVLAQQDKLYVKGLLERIKCIGVIEREGMDASGQPLEEEYYYDPEKDSDFDRRVLAEQSKGHVGIRNCRKQHKQYYWKKPRK